MKHLGSYIFLGLLTVALLFFGYESLSSYMGTHTYYKEMLSSQANRIIFISVLICALLPVWYLICAKRFKIKKLTMYLAGGLAVYGLLHSVTKGGTVGFGRCITMINTLLLFALGVYTFTGFFALGSWIEKKRIRFTQHRRQELLLILGTGMIVFLALVQIAVGLGILYGIVSRLLFLGLGFLIYWERESLKKWGTFLDEFLGGIKEKVSGNTPWLIAISVLLLISVMYFYYGFQNSFIPYSTARDANHEYMYIPKVIAENAGILWGGNVGGGMPGMWHIFITFFFSLTGATHGRLGLSSSTISVSMNFWSAVLVLILGIGLVYQITSFLCTSPAEENPEEKAEQKIGIVVGRSVLLLWLTSGMGAFLVMVDNKTDLGVMALSLLALLAGMIFLGILQQKTAEKKEIWRYLIIAGIFFSFACLAKPTAFVDIALFGMFLVGLRISPRSALGIGLGLGGILRYMNILTSSFMITQGEAKWLIIIGGCFTLLGVLLACLKKEKVKQIGTSIGYLCILGISFLLPLILFKAPRILRNQIVNDAVSPTAIVKGLFAQASGDIERQNLIDEQILNTSGTVESVAQPTSRKQGQLDANVCVTLGYSEEELKEGLQEVKGSGLSEDVGRYIGFGWKEFTRKGNGVYRLLKLIFPTSQHCYGTNTEAKFLCEYGEAIDNFEITTLRYLYTYLPNQGSEAGLLLKEALETFSEKIGEDTNDYNPQEFRDQIVALRQYYQSHSIKSDATKVAIPYRYLIPLNITFNRSLQNLSSYYTDIGFSRILLYIILIITLPYALIKQDKKLISLSLTTLIGRGIWWIIGGGILRYGTVLISRTMITTLAFANKLWKESNTSLKPIVGVLIGCILVGISIQVYLNFFRISSQGANGPFVWYKGNVGQETEVTDTLEMKTKIAYGYTMKNVFNLQFPQYNAIITALKDRKNEDGVIIAGTYSQYFLDNQRNVKLDGMLMSFWVNASDGNICKTYRRLKDSNTKYLIIDPNIGTVGMGEGNETLFHRFFAKLNAVSGTIEEDGTLTTLVKMYQLGYIKLFSTNTIGAYYAFNLTDEELAAAFGARDEEGMVLLRAKLIGIRYFPDEANILFGQIGNLFIQRVMAGQGVEEIASILGAEIDSAKIYALLPTAMQRDFSGIAAANLTQAEKMVLVQYLSLYLNFANNNPNASESVQNLLMTSIGNSSQVMAFELI